MASLCPLYLFKLLVAMHSSHDLMFVTSPNACWEALANIISWHPFHVPASPRWPLATRSIPLRLVFVPFVLPFSFLPSPRHILQMWPPDRMALYSKAWSKMFILRKDLWRSSLCDSSFLSTGTDYVQLLFVMGSNTNTLSKHLHGFFFCWTSDFWHSLGSP